MIGYVIEKSLIAMLLGDHSSFTKIPFLYAGTVKTQSIISDHGVRSKNMFLIILHRLRSLKTG